MKLSSLVEKDLILTKQKISSRADAIEKSVSRLIDKKNINLPKDQLIQEIMERDKLGGTVFDTGLAIPHARIKDYGDLSIVICIPESEVDVEGKKINCFIVMITSLAVSNLYLQVLASIAGFSQNKNVFSQLTSSSNPDAVIKVLSEIYVKKELTVGDLMSTELVTVNPEMTLKEIINLFYTKNTSYLPVLSPDNTFLGEVRINDVLSIGIPEYAVTIGDLGFLKSFAPLERLMNSEEDLQVKTIMKKSLVSLRPESSIIEAVMKMTQGNLRHLPVIKDGKILGVLSVMDILHKVLRR